MKIKPTISIFFCVFFVGCTTLKTGDFDPISHYVHPGSKIKNLGAVSAEVNDWGFMLPPEYDYEKTITLFEEALNKKPGADLLINYRIDNILKTVPFFFIYTMKVTLQGDAADVEIGKEY